MSPSENFEARVESLLKNRSNMENTIKRQESKIAQLSTHKKTLVSALVSRSPSNHYPVALEYAQGSNPVEVSDAYPFYLLNLGSLRLSSARDVSSEVLYPSDYKIARIFPAHSSSNSERPEIVYTSTILNKWGETHYVTRDDENNVFKEPDAFEQFKRAFAFPLPFSGIEEWLGLTNPAVVKCIQQLRKPEEPKNMGTLDNYFR